jgi:hypothetical protein
VLAQGERLVESSPKRACNRCFAVLGDLTDTELATATLGRRLPPVHGECPHCLGYHTVLVEPAQPTEPGAAETPLLPAVLRCPGTPAGKLARGVLAIASCCTWQRCGCVFGKDIEYPSAEWVEFLDAHCPTSPTGEHRHLIERDVDGTPYVGAPVAGTCRYVDALARLRGQSEDGAVLDRLVADFATGPGLYAVEIEEFDPDTLVFEPLDITSHVPAEVAPL